MNTDEQRKAALDALEEIESVLLDDHYDETHDIYGQPTEYNIFDRVSLVRAALQTPRPPERKRVDLEKLKKTHRAYVDLGNSVYSNVLFNERADGYNAAIEDMKQFDVFERE